MRARQCNLSALEMGCHDGIQGRQGSAGQSSAELNRPEQGRAGQSRAEQNRAGQRAEQRQSRAEQDRAGQGAERAKAGRAGQSRTKECREGQSRTKQRKAGRAGRKLGLAEEEGGGAAEIKMRTGAIGDQATVP